MIDGGTVRTEGSRRRIVTKINKVIVSAGHLSPNSNKSVKQWNENFKNFVNFDIIVDLFVYYSRLGIYIRSSSTTLA